MCMTGSWSAGVRERLTGAQQREVARLQGVSGELRVELTRILELADELGQGTIERQLAKSDLELGLEQLVALGSADLTSGARVDGVDRADGVPAVPASGDGEGARVVEPLRG